MTYVTCVYSTWDEFNGSALNRQVVHDRPDWQQVGWDLTGRQYCVSAYHSPRSFNISVPLSSVRAPYLMSSTQ